MISAALQDKKWLLRVCPDCTGELIGHWGEGWPSVTKGAVCWMSHHAEGDGVELECPRNLTCRVCMEAKTREEILKRWVIPYHLSVKEMTYECGCAGMDSSG